MIGRDPRVAVMLMLSLGAVAGVAAVSCRENAASSQSRSASTVVEAGPKRQSDILIFPDELRVADESVNEFVTRAMNTCAAGEYEAFRLLWSVREDPLPRGEFEQGWQAVQLIRIRALEQARLIIPPSSEATTSPSASPARTVSATEEAARRKPGSPEAATVPAGGSGGGASPVVTPTAPASEHPEPAEEVETVYLILAEVRFDPEHPAGRQQANREVALMLVQERGQWRIANPPKVIHEWLRKEAETAKAGQPPATTSGADDE